MITFSICFDKLNNTLFIPFLSLTHALITNILHAKITGIKIFVYFLCFLAAIATNYALSALLNEENYVNVLLLVNNFLCVT